jgi:hypothetical protein
MKRVVLDLLFIAGACAVAYGLVSPGSAVGMGLGLYVCALDKWGIIPWKRWVWRLIDARKSP